jgi:hypothetical protein
LGLALFFVGFLAFGVVVEMRSAFLKRHMTDLGVYLRAGWAVRTDADLYSVTDDNSWHYHYPSLFAIFMVPLADPPPGADRTGMLPFGVSAALWYVFSLACLALAVHLLAGALEATSPDPALRAQPHGCRRWWAWRVGPVLACLPPIGHTLMRGQVNLLLLLLLCGMAAALLRGRRLQAGFWLAGAICLKIIPAFLLVYPIWRRDRRCLAGCFLGLVLGLGVIPSLVFGPARTWAYFQEWDQALRQPALGAGSDQSRAKELIEVTATDSQSFLAIIHNTVNLERATRPTHPSARTRVAHWLIGGVLTVLTILAAGWRRDRAAAREVIFLGALIVLMMLLSPVCHLHYFCLLVPLILGLAWAAAERRPSAWWIVVWGLVIINGLASVLPHLPGLEMLRDVGLVTYASLLLWLAGTALLCTRERKTTAAATGFEVSGVAA